MRRAVLTNAIVAVAVLTGASTLAACTSSTSPRSTPPSSRSSSSVATTPPPPSSSSPPVTPSTPATSPTSPTSTHTVRVSPTTGRRLVVVLNPGHNGGNATHTAQIDRLVPAGYGTRKACDTTGTETNAGYTEHAFNWDVAKRIRAILQAHGITVIMTRHNDHGVGPCVDRRTEIGNAPDVAAVVSIHADGAPSSGHGFHVNQDSRRPDGATARVAHLSDLLGQAVHGALQRSSGLVPSTYIGQDGYYYRTDLAGLDLATRPATFLELGNMRNAGDASLQTSSSGRQRIAAAVATGILTYLARHP